MHSADAASRTWDGRCYRTLAEVDDYEEQVKELISKVQASLENELPNLTGKARMDVGGRGPPLAQAPSKRACVLRGGSLVGTRDGNAQKCNYIKGRIDRVRQVYQHLKVELRELPKADAREYEKVCRGRGPGSNGGVGR